jgi:cytoskeletal protein CcmA (bactofilin family)
MGIFGRDDEVPENTPVQKAPKDSAKPATTGARGGSENRTVIARSTRVEGRVHVSGEIVINGEHKGAIEGSGSVRIAENGRVEAKVNARDVSVAGHIKGDITASERIELSASASVEGNIAAPRILIQDGATFKGQVIMKDSPARGTVTTSSARKNFQS